MSYSNNRDEGLNGTDLYGRTDILIQGRITATNYFGSLSMLKFGAETYAFKRKEGLNELYRDYTDQLSAAFAETDLFFTQKWVARIGLRSEYSSYLNKFNLSPRTSLSYKTGKSNQVSIAYGRFYQNPEDEYLILKPLDYEQAGHYIANFQRITNAYTFRVEVKNQHNGITYRYWSWNFNQFVHFSKSEFNCK